MSKNRCKQVLQFPGNFLRYISVGKIQLAFYHNESQTYSTIIGGLIFLLFAAVIIAYTVLIFWMIFWGNKVEVDTSYIHLGELAHKPILDDMKLSWLTDRIDNIQVVSNAKISNFSDPDEIKQVCTNQTFDLWLPRYGPQRLVTLAVTNVTYAGLGESTTNLAVYCTYKLDSPENSELLSSITYHELFYCYDAIRKNKIPCTIQWYFRLMNPDDLVDTYIMHAFIEYRYQVNLQKQYDDLTKYIKIIPDDTELNLYFMIYNHTDDKIGILPTYNREILLWDITKTPDYEVDEQVNERLLRIAFAINPLFIQITETPYNFVTGLASIGGLIALLLLLAIPIAMIHRCTFKQSLKNMIKEKIKKQNKTKESTKKVNDSIPNLVVNVTTDESQLLNSLSKSRTELEETLDEIDTNNVESLFSYKCFKIAINQIKQLQKENQDIKQRLQYMDNSSLGIENLDKSAELPKKDF